MKELNKLIRKKIFEIIFIVIFLIGSEPIWEKVHKETELSSTIALNGSSYLEIDNPINYLMRPMSDEKAINYLKPCHITIKNALKDDADYTLTLKVSKDSTMDLNNIHILINDKVYNLTSLNKENETDNVYYILAQDNLKENNEYDVIFWLKENAYGTSSNQKLIFNFELIKSNIEI